MGSARRAALGSVAGWCLAISTFAVTVDCLVSTEGSGQTAPPGDDGASGASGASGAGGSVLVDATVGNDSQLDPDTACAVTSLQASPVPLEIFFLLDTSGSMAYEGKISGLMVGIFRFLGDPSSVGLGAAAQQFPLPIDTDPEDESCLSTDYATPAIAWGTLPSSELREWVLTLEPAGFTPTVPALQGAVDACRARIAAVPSHRCAVVIVTDGKPEGHCDPVDAQAQAPLAAIAGQALANGIPVFAIGFPGLPPLGQTILEAVSANGGTGHPILIESGNVGSDFANALGSIRRSALTCDYQMPVAEAGTVQPDLVLVQYTAGDGSVASIPRRWEVAACGSDDGWWYDDNANPTRLTLCPETCERVQQDVGGRIDVYVGCASNLK